MTEETTNDKKRWKASENNQTTEDNQKLLKQPKTTEKAKNRGKPPKKSNDRKPLKITETTKNACNDQKKPKQSDRSNQKSRQSAVK